MEKVLRFNKEKMKEELSSAAASNAVMASAASAAAAAAEVGVLGSRDCWAGLPVLPVA